MTVLSFDRGRPVQDAPVHDKSVRVHYWDHDAGVTFGAEQHIWDQDALKPDFVSELTGGDHKLEAKVLLAGAFSFACNSDLFSPDEMFALAAAAGIGRYNF